jgi:hypothetical protein
MEQSLVIRNWPGRGGNHTIHEGPFMVRAPKGVEVFDACRKTVAKPEKKR